MPVAGILPITKTAGTAGRDGCRRLRANELANGDLDGLLVEYNNRQI